MQDTAIDVDRLLSETSLRHVEWLEEVDSTNLRAIQVANDLDTTLPCLIGTEHQTAGRGRGSNRWWGAPGSLMFSIVVDMPGLGLKPTDWPRFSLVTGLAISETLGELFPPGRVGLKWPNDVWLDHKKVCGILIEQSDRAPDRLIVGIGLNVNNSFASSPIEQKQVAVSMSDAAQGQQFSRTEVLIAIINRWRMLVQELSDQRLNLVERWSRNCVLSGHSVMLKNGNSETIGVCVGIDDDGALLLRTAFAVERHYAGTVRLLET